MPHGAYAARCTWAKRDGLRESRHTQGKKSQVMEDDDDEGVSGFLRGGIQVDERTGRTARGHSPRCSSRMQRAGIEGAGTRRRANVLIACASPVLDVCRLQTVT